MIRLTFTPLLLAIVASSAAANVLQVNRSDCQIIWVNTTGLPLTTFG